MAAPEALAAGCKRDASQGTSVWRGVRGGSAVQIHHIDQSPASGTGVRPSTSLQRIAPGRHPTGSVSANQCMLCARRPVATGAILVPSLHPIAQSTAAGAGNETDATSAPMFCRRHQAAEQPIPAGSRYLTGVRYRQTILGASRSRGHQPPGNLGERRSASHLAHPLERTARWRDPPRLSRAIRPATSIAPPGRPTQGGRAEWISLGGTEEGEAGIVLAVGEDVTGAQDRDHAAAGGVAAVGGEQDSAVAVVSSHVEGDASGPHRVEGGAHVRQDW